MKLGKGLVGTRRVAAGLVLAVALTGAEGAATPFGAQSVSASVDANRLTFQGGKLSEAQAQGLEQALKQNPGDLAIRAELIGYYWRQFGSSAAREALHTHVLWVIENHPEAGVAGVTEVGLDPCRDGQAYERAVVLWQDALASHPSDAAVLWNAAHFVLIWDSTFAETLLDKGEALEPANPRWPRELGELYRLQWQRASVEERPALAAESFEAFERAYSRTTEEKTRSYMLGPLAVKAFEAGEFDQAKGYADLALDAAKRWPKDWNAGNDVHQGNLVLGRLALRAGDVQCAEAYLLAAGKTHGSPQLDSFGPNMELAKELLEHGERAPVLQYLDLCGRFWSSGKEKLQFWSETIRDGGTPDFGANLYY